MRHQRELSPELRSLRGGAARLWRSPAERRRALEAIANALDHHDPSLDSAVQRVDRAIVEALHALSLPRGPVHEVRLTDEQRAWAGIKYPDCSLVLDAGHLLQQLGQVGSPNSTFRTWIHESLHARQPFALHSALEQRRYRGYEEGMVEGLTRLIVEKGALRPVLASYDYYVTAYRTMARTLGLTPERLLRQLWTYPTGEVRVGLVEAVDSLQRDQLEGDLVAVDHARLRAIADTVFASDRIRYTANEEALNRLWLQALR